MKKQWQCSHGCQDADITICKHLESLLPKSTHLSVGAYLDRLIENKAIEEPEVIVMTEREAEFRDRLGSYGIEDIRIDVLTLKFVYGLSFAQIAEELHIPSRNTVQYIYNKALNLLRERGFSL